ncbi:hypothetical protein VPH35_094864 [Triticum aestivum]
MSTSNESLLKKRNIQELHMAELSDDKIYKKKKAVILDHLNKFLVFISNLTDDQKNILQTIPTNETVQFTNTFLQSATPTTEQLFSMITPTITEEAFSRIFLLLTLSILIAPNSKGLLSKKILQCFGGHRFCSQIQLVSFCPVFLGSSN